MSSKLLMWVPLVAASGISATYIFVVGVDWEFTFRSGTVALAIVTSLILSAWASVPYFILLPIARREGLSLITILAVTVILAFGLLSIERGRHTPGDEGGSYIVVPFQQMVIAAVILIGWRSIRRLTR
jgi:hypothetical protein